MHPRSTTGAGTVGPSSWSLGDFFRDFFFPSFFLQIFNVSRMRVHCVHVRCTTQVVKGFEEKNVLEQPPQQQQHHAARVYQFSLRSALFTPVYPCSSWLKCRWRIGIRYCVLSIVYFDLSCGQSLHDILQTLSPPNLPYRILWHESWCCTID